MGATSMLEVQMPSLIVLLGHATSRETMVRETLKRRLAGSVPDLCRVVVPSGDDLSQAVGLSRAVRDVISRDATVAAHEHGSAPGRAVRLILLSDPGCVQQVWAIAKWVSEAATDRGMGFVCYPVFVDTQESPESEPRQVSQPGNTLTALSCETAGGRPLFTRVLYASSYDRRTRLVPCSAVWGQAVEFVAWAVCPTVMRAMDRMLVRNALGGSACLGSFGLVCYVSDRMRFANEAGVAVGRALEHKLASQKADTAHGQDLVDANLADAMRKAFSAGAGLDKVVDTYLSSAVDSDAWNAESLSERVERARHALSAVDAGIQTQCHELEREIVRLELAIRFYEAPPPPAPAPEPRGCLALLLPFLRKPKPPNIIPAPDGRAALRQELAAKQETYKQVRQRRKALEPLFETIDQRLYRLRDLSAQAMAVQAGENVSAKEGVAESGLVRNVYAWQEFQPTLNEGQLADLLNEFARERLVAVLDGAPVEEEAANFTLTKLEPRESIAPDAFLAACAASMPPMVDLLLDESSPLWAASAFDPGGHHTIAVLPEGERSPLAPALARAGVTIATGDRPEVWFISLACSDKGT